MNERIKKLVMLIDSLFAVLYTPLVALIYYVTWSVTFSLDGRGAHVE